MSNTRIELTDTTMDVILKMSDGNPGAMTVLVALLKEGELIDPDAAFGGLSALIMLDSSGVYGEKIWMLYKDICNQSAGKMIGILRAVQLGFLAQHELHEALSHGYGRMDYTRQDEVLKLVRERLPEFKG